LQATLAGCDRATRLVEQLLTLSRLEFGSSSALVRVDLCPLIRAAVAAVAPQALGKSQSLLVEADQPCPIAGDTTLLTVLIRNLVDNAIRYSPRHATVKVVATVLGARVQLRVDDSGPGMTVSHMQRVGERFFRVLGSGEEGSGLGWSIARRIAAVHGAQVRVSPSVELGGLSVEVEWPVFQNGQGPFPNPILNQKESI
jgi:two-component system sensor histidine kinase QseC